MTVETVDYSQIYSTVNFLTTDCLGFLVFNRGYFSQMPLGLHFFISLRNVRFEFVRSPVKTCSDL